MYTIGHDHTNEVKFWLSAILHQGDAYCMKRKYQELGVNSAAPIQWISNSNNGSCRNGLVLWLSYTIEQKEKNRRCKLLSALCTKQ